MARLEYPPVPRALLRDPGHLLSLGLGSGCAPHAPGTAGTGLGVIVYLALAELPGHWYLAAVALAFVVGVWACGRTGRVLGVSDHPAIVWDEVVGYLVTMMAAPRDALWLFIGFVLFRFFDIVKPWPIRSIDQRVHGGLGVMLDDLVAGLFSLFFMHVILYFSLSYR